MIRSLRCLTIALAAALIAAPSAGSAQQQAGRPDTASAGAADVAQAQMDGKTGAMTVGTGGWFGSGIATGVFTGLIGTVVIYAVAGSSNVNVAPEKAVAIAGKSQNYQAFYQKSYADEVKSKRKSSALKGGLLGTAAFVALFLAANSSAQ